MSWSLFAAAAVLLSLERICYVAIWRTPAAFRAWCAHPAVAWIGEPVATLQWLFVGFKGLQIAVFLAWCYLHGAGTLAPQAADEWTIATGGLLILVGQSLNAGVFYRLGVAGVFYGIRFGYDVPWCRQFPFSHFSHPQYIGAVLSIWGFFLAMRYPHPDWAALPALETMFYMIGARLER